MVRRAYRWATIPVGGKTRGDTQKNLELIQLKVDNGPESSGVRTQFLKRTVAWVDHIGKPLQLLYYSAGHFA